jgi:diguanylate cyclase (GGDEF)-like protein/PAS domain S-box-containing protein
MTSPPHETAGAGAARAAGAGRLSTSAPTPAPGGRAGVGGVHDPARLAALRATGLLDTPPEPAFDRLTRLATTLLRAPSAAVSLVDDRRQFFKSAVGLAEPWASRRETPLSHSFCRHVVERRRPLVVDDASEHPLVRDNLAVSELGVSAYLGVPLVTPGGQVIGALCVIDGAPRAWGDDEVEQICELAASVMTEIELRRALGEAKARADEAERAAAELARARDEIARGAATLGAVLAAMDDAVAVADAAGGFAPLNAAAERLFERAPGDAPPGDLSAAYGLYRADGVTTLPADEVPVVRALAGEHVSQLELFVRTRGAPEGRWHSVNATPLGGEGAAPRGAVLVGRDVTARKEAEAELREREARLRRLADAAFEGIAVSHEGVMIDGNEAFGAMFGYAPREVVGLSVTAFVHPDERDRVAHRHRTGFEGAYETVGRRKDGSTFPVEVRGRTVPWGGRVVRITAVRDLTERKRDEEALARKAALVRLLSETAAEANSAATVGAALCACVGRVCRHVGWPVGHVQLVGRGAAGPELAPADLWHLDDAARFRAFRDATLATRLPPGVGLPGLVLADGRPHWMVDVRENSAFSRRDAAAASGLRAGLAFPVLVGREVAAVLEFYSERAEEPDGALLEAMANVGTQLGRVVERERALAALERHAAEIQALSITDELTGLYNRRGFLSLAAPQLKLADRSGRGALLFFADINGMKQINDELGHDAGDEAIRATARLLRATFRESDLLARLGGDEFVVLAPDAGPDAIGRLHARLAGHVDAYNRASVGRPFRLSVSLGAAVYDPRRPRGVEALLAEADKLMYEQKRSRKRAAAVDPAAGAGPAEAAPAGARHPSTSAASSTGAPPTTP